MEEEVFPKEPMTDHVPVNDSETQSQDVAKYVAKRRKEADEERVKS